MDLSKLLLESSNYMYEYAIKKCGSDFVDEKHGCVWYHSVWQYLRILNCVSSPQWHEEFYSESLKNALKNNNEAKILISGTADYSMLHLIVTEVSNLSIKTTITILDKCETPLEICKWYVKNYETYINNNSNLNNLITFEFVQKDILLLDAAQKYDIICADAFLTRFDRYSAKSILLKWKNHLKSNGRIITTIRIHENETKSLLSATMNILNFNNKVKSRYSEFIKRNGSFPITEDLLLFLSNRYIIKMHSNAIGNKDEIIQLFNECDLTIDLATTSYVEGEVNPTEYLQIVAIKQ